MLLFFLTQTQFLVLSGKKESYLGVGELLDLLHDLLVQRCFKLIGVHDEGECGDLVLLLFMINKKIFIFVANVVHVDSQYGGTERPHEDITLIVEVAEDAF